MLIVVVSWGCDISTPTKKITADYYLEEINTFYYLQWKGHEVEGVGVLEGTVVQIGWTNSTILAARIACFSGDLSGWMVINTVNHTIRGPISESERQTKYKAITTYSVQEAWNRR
jgi:hypothetical protein